MQTTSPQDQMAPCPGCGGRGGFAWGTNPKIPKCWAPNAPCGMCKGSGTIPAAWLAKKHA